MLLNLINLSKIIIFSRFMIYYRVQKTLIHHYLIYRQKNECKKYLKKLTEIVIIMFRVTSL